MAASSNGAPTETAKDTPQVASEEIVRPPEPAIIGKLMIEAWGASDPGCVRSNNEDSYLVDEKIGLYVVADGMGGAQAGEHASQLAVKTVQEAVQNEIRSITPEQLTAVFQTANEKVMEAAAANPEMEGMGTTLVVAIDRGDDLLIASVGDSRLYTFSGGMLHTVTEDQTWVNEVGRRLGIDEENLKNHPMRHVLTMAVGVSENLRVHTYQVKPSAGMQILLCSDGLHGVVKDDDISETLAAQGTLAAKGRHLIETARSRGGPDNITVVLLQAH